MPGFKKAAITLAPCEGCRRETRHRVLQRHTESYGDDVVWGATENEMLRCRGCNTISLRRTDTFSENVEPDGKPIPTVVHFPMPSPRVRPDWVDQLNIELVGLMDEIYEARRTPLVRLIAMGVRAVIDVIMVSEIGDVGGFEEKLDALLDKGLISERQRDLLATVVDAGSAAGHRGFKPNIALIDAMIDAIENLLHAHFIVQPMVEQLKLTIPPRPPRPTKKGGPSLAAKVVTEGLAIPPPPSLKR